MKKIVLAVIFILFGRLSVNGQENLPLKYRLEPGDMLHYKVVSKDMINSYFEYEYWLTFEVIEKDRGQFKMSLRFEKIYEKLGDVVYNSQEYYTENKLDFIPPVKQLALQQAIFFTLGEFGEISDIMFSEELKSVIKTNILGISNKRKLSKLSLLSKDNLRELIRSVFNPLPEKAQAQSWFRVVPAAELLPELKFTYEHTGESKSDYTITIRQVYENIDSTVFSQGGLIQFMPKSIEQNGEINIGKDNALLNTLNIVSESTIINSFTNRGTQKSTVHNRVALNIEKIVKPESGKMTIVSGTLPDYTTWKSVRLFIWQNFPDHELIDLTVKPEGNQFFARFNLERPTEIAIMSESVSSRLANYNSFLVEPGDSLIINLDGSGSNSYSGRGAGKNNLRQKIRDYGPALSLEMPFGETRRIVQKNLRGKTKFLEQSKATISSWAHNHIQADTYFREQRNMHNYYIGKTNRKPDPELFQKLFGDLDIASYTTSRSFEFRWFIADYIKSQTHITQGYKVEQVIPNSELYTMAKLLLKGEQEYYTTAYYVDDAMKIGGPSRYDAIYKDFSSRYLGSTLQKALKRTYETKANIALGEIAPDFTLQDMSGKTFKLTDLSGKWVWLTFCDLNVERYQNDLKKFSQMADSLPKDAFQLVVAFSHKEMETTKRFLEENKLNALYLDNHGWKSETALRYNMPYLPDNYLINPDGEIEFIGGASSWDEHIREFTDYIEDDFEQRTIEKAAASETSYRWIIPVAIGAIGLIWLYFIVKTKRLKRQEKAKLDKVEMEIKAVRSQLNPHFLFNAMSSIQHLVNINDNEKANIFLSRFAGLMRKVLNQADLQLQSLAQELDTLNDYLSLEALRHGFQFSIQVDDQVDIHSIDIPPMLLQPFVENAVVHGVSQSNRPGEIAIRITNKSPESISITIADNGVGLYASAHGKPQSNGKGLELTKRRIALIMEKFKNEISFILKDRKELDGQSGALAEIIVQLEH